MKVSDNSLQFIHDYWIDLKNRELWIHGIDRHNDNDYGGEEPGVEYMMANRVIKNLLMLRHESATKPIVVHLHTCGGLWEEGMAIYDAIKMMPCPVTIVSHTHARSMSSIILQAGTRRLLLPSSHFMFHWGTLEVGGHAPTVYSNVDFTRTHDETMLDIYVQSCMGSTRFKKASRDSICEELRRTMDKKGDVFLTAKETVEWGLADAVIANWNDIYKT
jgi:ATP-dependent Clp protease protease subunit